MSNPALPLVRRTRLARPDTPQCQRPFVREVGANGYPLPSWFEQRDAKLVRRGFDPTLCGRSSSWIVNGIHYCGLHAGITALEILEGRDDAAQTAQENL